MPRQLRIEQHWRKQLSRKRHEYVSGKILGIFPETMQIIIYIFGTLNGTKKTKKPIMARIIIFIVQIRLLPPPPPRSSSSRPLPPFFSPTVVSRL
jgi:hypothetical protein